MQNVIIVKIVEMWKLLLYLKKEIEKRQRSISMEWSTENLNDLFKRTQC